MSLKRNLIESPVIRYYKGRWQPEFTRYWIIRDSELFKRISRLEAAGHIKFWEEKISKNKELQEALLRLHKHDIALRKELLQVFFQSDEAQKIDKKTSEYLQKVLSDEKIGLGGIRNWQGHFHIKCLHLWTAYHIGNKEFENFLGEFVLESLSQITQ